MSTTANVAETEDQEWIGLHPAAWLIGRGTGWIQRKALCGLIRTRVLPGVAPRYRREDVEKLAAAPQPEARPEGVSA
jgi:hypothetical protein